MNELPCDYPAEVAAVADLGLHPEEAKPRGLTFIHERLNWQHEVKQLRERVASLEKEARYWRSIAPKD